MDWYFNTDLKLWVLGWFYVACYVVVFDVAINYGWIAVSDKYVFRHGRWRTDESIGKR